MKKKKNSLLVSRGRYYDFNLIAAVILLCCFGLVMLYSTSAYRAEMDYGNDMKYFGKQAIISTVSIILVVAASRFDYHLLAKFSGFLYGISILFMLMVKFSPLGVEVNGAKRWLKLGVQFQPSEISKIAIIICIPLMIIKMGKNIKSWKACGVLIATGAIQALCAFILTENLSTGLIIGAMTVLMVFIAHPKTKTFLKAFLIGAALVIVAYIILRIVVASGATSDNFRIRRILVWLRPEDYSKDGGYQIMQGLYAIGSGGFFGKGLGNSVQKLSAVPEAQNDMIFSIICEELGVFGAIIILLLFAYLLYRLQHIAINAPDLFGSLMVSGIFIHIALQVILNICVVTNVIPTTGITLPFFSYGGTSILFLMAEIGIALSVSAQIKEE